MRIVLIDSDEERRPALAMRLRAQGYVVGVAADAAQGASMALSDPPDGVVADLWMPGISGIQLCRLLHAEPSTMDVPVILRATTDEPRNRFWADRAGAAGYVAKGRMGELVRTLARVVVARDSADSFFTDFTHSGIDIRDRIAAHLDEALFESVLAAETRALGVCGSFERLFDLFSQVVSQVTTYRWLALSTGAPRRLGLHANPRQIEVCHQEAKALLAIKGPHKNFSIEDEDASPVESGACVLVEDIVYSDLFYGRLAMSPVDESSQTRRIMRLLARELGGPIRMVTLVEESQRLASTDSLTGLNNRRSFTTWMGGAVEEAQEREVPLSMLLLDVDRFKAINDTHGHAGGDMVLAGLGEVIDRICPESGFAARWGGEEFVIGLAGMTSQEAVIFADGLRREIEAMKVHTSRGPIPVTASIGVGTLRFAEGFDVLVDRADRAMYMAKSCGRNKVISDLDLDTESLADDEQDSPASLTASRGSMEARTLC